MKFLLFLYFICFSCYGGEKLQDLLDAKNYQKALELLEQKSDRTGSDYYYLYVCSLKLGAKADALEYINTAIEKEEKNTDYLFALSELLLSMQQSEKALVSLRRIIRIDPKNQKARDLITDTVRKMETDKYQSVNSVSFHGNAVPEKITFNKIPLKHDFMFQPLNKRVIGPQTFCVTSDRIYAADNLRFKICVFDKTGKFLFEFGKEGRTEGAFYRIFDISATNDMIYVVDFSRNDLRLMQFDEKGVFKKQKKFLPDKEFSQISHIRALPDGILAYGLYARQAQTVKFDKNLDFKKFVPGINSYSDIYARLSDYEKNIILYRNQDNLLKEIKTGFRNLIDMSTIALVNKENDIYVIGLEKLSQNMDKKRTHADMLNRSVFIYKTGYNGALKAIYSYDRKDEGLNTRTKRFEFDETGHFYIFNTDNNSASIYEAAL